MRCAWRMVPVAQVLDGVVEDNDGNDEDFDDGDDSYGDSLMIL